MRKAAPLSRSVALSSTNKKPVITTTPVSSYCPQLSTAVQEACHSVTTTQEHMDYTSAEDMVVPLAEHDNNCVSSHVGYCRSGGAVTGACWLCPRMPSCGSTCFATRECSQPVA